MQETVIKLEHITREFPGVLANDDVSLEIHRGEVFALVGENGAGKSTLMNIIYGIFPPTDGSVYIRGKKVETFSPKNAIDMGIGMVHQHFMLVPSFTVAQNIVMSREPRRAGLFFDNRRAEEITRELVREYGLNVDPSAQVQDISVGVQQRVEILKALYRGADILILDEPTAVLTPQETAELFRVIRHIIKEKNMTVILITHKLGEVMAISDRVGIMRQGKLVGLSDTKDITEKEIASMMVGRPVLFDKLEKTGAPGETMISVENLSVRDNRGLVSVRSVSLEARAGEVLGIAAIEGNGQSELLEAITGMRPAIEGRVRIRGTDALGLSPGQIRQLGLAHVPGIDIIFSIPGLKVHAKVALVLRENDKGERLRSYAYVSTGNFNEKTAKIYADIALYTCNKQIVEDMYTLFRVLRKELKEPHFKRLLIARFNLLPELKQLIQKEINLVHKGYKINVQVRLLSSAF